VRDGSDGSPVVGEEFVEAVDGMGADALEDVAKIGERINLESLTRGDEAGEYGGGSPTVIATEEQPVFPSDGDSPQASLGAVVVALEVSVFAVAGQGFPVLHERPHTPVMRHEPCDGHPAVNARKATVQAHSPKSEKNATMLQHSSGNEEYSRVRAND